MPAAAAQVVHGDGHLVLPRLIRYIEERRANERRFTGAIEADPSPLHVVWGLDDPIAVPSMVDTLLAARPDATAARLARGGPLPHGRGAAALPRRGAARARLSPQDSRGPWLNLTPCGDAGDPRTATSSSPAPGPATSLVGTEAALITPDDALLVREEGAVRWHRCLRCDDWVAAPDAGAAESRHGSRAGTRFGCPCAARRCATATCCA